MREEFLNGTASPEPKVSQRGVPKVIGRAPRPAWLRFGVAILSVAAAWALRHVLTPVIGPTELPFMFFFPSVVVAAAFGGWHAGLLAIALASLVTRWSFFEPLHSFSLPPGHAIAGFLTFVAVSLLMIGFIEGLHRERELLAVTLHSIGDAVVVTDAGGCVTFLNPEAERLTGWKISDAKGKALSGVFSIVNELTRHPVENPVEKVLRLGTVMGLANHTILVARNGAETPIDDSAAPIRDFSGRLVGTVLIFRDITERRAAERAAARLGSIVEESQDAIIGKDLKGVVTNWNKAAERIFGYSAAEMIGQSIRILIPADRQGEEDRILAALARGERVDHLETIRKTKAGREIHVSVSSSPIKDPEGRIIGASKIAQDITFRKTMEAELAETNAHLKDVARELEDTVAKRTAHLQTTIAELESVSYSLSHDMRAPLRTIQGFSQIILAEAGEKLGELEKSLLQKSINAALRLDRLIQDVLTYSRVAREKIELSTIDVEQLVHQIIDERPDLQPPKAEIVIQAPLQPVCGHEAYLSQCISNLLDNGVKFVPPGTQPRIRIWSETNDGLVRLWFEDNGVGIPKEAQERIFGLFQRMYTEKEFPGTGVGLTIVRKAVERMDGKVGVESEPGKGSRFWMQLRKESQA
jgi:PAS domain S-box-containing protein